MRHIIPGILILGLFFMVSCGKSEKEITRAFYHWKTEFAPNNEEKDLLNDLQVKKIFVKYFDIDWNEEMKDAQPRAKIYSENAANYNEIIPTVFITNRTFIHLPEENIPGLAKKTFQLIEGLHSSIFKTKINEIQMDCDWTASTQRGYFHFLDELKNLMAPDDIRLSATVRLHQYRYPEKTGVPPVSRGMLMVYNTGELDNPDETNSIFGVDEIRNYIEPSEDYPLPLDVALPVFSWGVLNRMGETIKLIHGLHPEECDTISWLEKTGKNTFKVLENHYFHSHYLYTGDRIRTETVEKGALLEVADMLGRKIKTDSITVAFYHLDALNLKHYEKEDLEAVYHRFH